MFGSSAPKPSIFGGATTTPSSTASTGFSFGNSNTTNAGTNIFGANTNPTSTGGTMPFGTAAQPTGGAGIFGGGVAAPPTGSIFSGTSAPALTSSTGLFGSSTTAPTASNIFGSSANSASSGGGIFGTTSSTTAPFGSSSTTPANVPGTPTFGSSTGTTQSTGLFGNTAAPTSAGGLFGSASTTTPSDATPTTTQGIKAPTTSTTSATTGGLFGKTPVTLSSTPGAPTTTGLFNSQPASVAATSSAPTGGLFGSTPSGVPSTGLSLNSKPSAATTSYNATAPAISTPKPTEVTPTLGLGLTSTPLAKGTGWTANGVGGLKGSATTTTNLKVGASGSDTLSEEEIIAGLGGTDSKSFFAALQEVVNSYHSEIAKQERVFNNKMLELNAYDRELISLEPKVLGLYSEMDELSGNCKKLNFNIASMTSVLNDIEETVVELEKKLNLPDWTNLEYKFPLDSRFASRHDIQRVQIAQMMLNVDSQMKSADFDLDQISQSLNNMQTTVLKTKTETPLEKTELIMKKQLQKLIDLSGQHDTTREKLAKLKDDHNLRSNNSKA